MNFVDAAVALLREAEAPLHVEDLCRLALERGLLDSPGANPLRSFKGRLTTELKRGDESRVIRVEDDLWGLSDAGREGGDGSSETESVEPEESELPPPYDDREARAADDEADEEGEDDDDDDFEDEEEGEDGEEDRFDEVEASRDEQPIEIDERPDGLQAQDAGGESESPTEPKLPSNLSPEEQELIAVYGDEVGTAQVGAISEYRDAQTADEDRPMTPEMTGERRGGRREREDWKSRRERMRKERREKREAREKERDARGGSNGSSASAAAAGPAREARDERDAGPRPGDAVHVEPGSGPSDLARRACEVLASIKGGQPVPVKQLAQMMRKRRLVEEDPERMWRALKSALLADTQRRLGAGLPPRVVYRGRDLFAYRPSGNPELEAAEAGLESAAHRLRGATERTLVARLADLALPALEQVAYLYLMQTGWREIDWIKRVDRSGYATAREPGDGQVLLVGVRAGNQELDRRGVGELRAGIAAKNLTRGLLLAPRELGGDARSELERPGPPVAVMAGLPWASSLVQAGIAVSQRMVPVAYLDSELLDRLAET